LNSPVPNFRKILPVGTELLDSDGRTDRQIYMINVKLMNVLF